MNIHYILIALTCLALSLDSAAMRGGRGGGGGGARMGGARAQGTHVNRPTTRPATGLNRQQNLGNRPGQANWNRAGYRHGYNWRNPVYAPVYVGGGYYPGYYPPDYTTSEEQLGISPGQGQPYYPGYSVYPNYQGGYQNNTNWSGY